MMSFDLIEYRVQNYPPGLKGWRFFRMEYGGHAEHCIIEGHIWLPPWMDIVEWEKDMKNYMNDTEDDLDDDDEDNDWLNDELSDVPEG